MQKYSFQQEPQPVPTQDIGGRTKKYRDPFDGDKSRSSANIMWDKRVYRGNTYAAQIVYPEDEELKRKEKERQRLRRQKELDSRKQQLEDDEMRKTAQEQMGIPPPEGRRHIEIQTDQYLEEIVDAPIEKDGETQTDAFNDRPPSPLFMPAKTGKDAVVQVEDDLFNFDFEVEPVLSVLIGKTLEQSLLEVMQEEEIVSISEEKQKFEAKRNAELAEIQRLESEERRRFEEKENRRKEEQARIKQEMQTKRKTAARQIAVDFVKNMEHKVFSNLVQQGHFYDVVERKVESFLPRLLQGAQEILEKKAENNEKVDSLIRKAMTGVLSMQRIQQN